ncbi:unnamed protein product [Mytilus coruscus]|uniref:Uncharacterized protein n=1 Tax=Mytilus coruscus TaxID=42192 RepID=A0A6J8DI32_MYTCO|nr:unnamed protein product [Mytilus coruscus]
MYLDKVLDGLPREKYIDMIVHTLNSNESLVTWYRNTVLCRAEETFGKVPNVVPEYYIPSCHSKDIKEDADYTMQTRESLSPKYKSEFRIPTLIDKEELACFDNKTKPNERYSKLKNFHGNFDKLHFKETVTIKEKFVIEKLALKTTNDHREVDSSRSHSPFVETQQRKQGITTEYRTDHLKIRIEDGKNIGYVPGDYSKELLLYS